MSAGDVVAAAQVQSLGTGTRAAVTSLLGSLTKDAVVLRMPQPPVGDSDAEELGLGSPQFTDVLLSPALVQQRGEKTLVTVAAEAMELALGVSGAEAVEEAVRSATFAVVSDRLLQVAQVERRAVYGRAYLYRLLLVAPELA